VKPLNFKRVIKASLPGPVRVFAAEIVARKRAQWFQSMPIDQAFDEIYKRRLWAGGTEMLSGDGSYGEWAERYVEFLQEFIKTHQIRSITDVGCGDFNIGSQLAALVSRYVALDISREIIKINQQLFGHLNNVTFAQANACSDPIEHADLVTVRQVLQHLTNRQIHDLLKNIADSKPRFVLVTEHVIAPEKMVRANIDMPSHSSQTRTRFGSGVLISEPPFSIPSKVVASFEVADEMRGAHGEHDRLCIFLWDLTAAG